MQDISYMTILVLELIKFWAIKYNSFIVYR